MLIDSHVHMVDSGEPVGEMMQNMRAGMEKCGFDKWCFAINTSEGIEAVHRNLLAFLYKLSFPDDTFIFAGLDYHIPGTSFETFGFSSQAERFCGIGVDGYKLYEGKPNARKICGNIPLTSSKYAGFFRLMDEKRMPVAVHLADPPEFWDASKLNAYQGSHGWFFGDLTFSSWREIYDEIFSLIREYRNIPFIIPQFGYLFPDLDKLAALLEDNNNLYFDIAPAGNYFEFLRNNAGVCSSFFEKYFERLIYASTGVSSVWREAAEKAERTLEALSGLRLSAAAMEKIKAGNFLSLCGRKTLNAKEVKNYASFVEEHIRTYSIIPARSGIVKRTFEVIDALYATVK